MSAASSSWFRSTLTAIAFAVIASTPSAAHARAKKAAAATTAPKLIVIVSVDQMRADYPALYGRAWKGGLRRLLTRGAVFEDARYPYLNTVTCAGHSTIGTGAFPHRHGMVLNSWWSRVLGRGYECTEDPGAPYVRYGEAPPSSTAPGHSANNLQVPTLADALKGSAGKPGLVPPPRIVSFSAKARSAIGMVGKSGDLVTWFDTRGWTTTRAFASAPDPMLARVLDAHPVASLVARPWTKVARASAYRFGDDAAVERPPMPFWTKVFPHALTVPAGAMSIGARPAPLGPLAAWDRSPMTDEMLLTLAKAVLTEGKLGQGPGTDVLAVSFSALDSVGHEFGPRSHEVQDVLLRLDRLLADLLQTLDRKVGPGRYTVALTADHGVATYPEQLVAEGKDAGRVPMAALGKKLTEAIVAELGPGAHVTNVRYTDLYLAEGVFRRLRGKPGAIDRVKAAIRSVDGVAAVFATDELRDPAAAKDPLQRAAAFSHFPGRSGDFALAPRANWLTTAEGTTHGTQNDYDQHVPLVFFGARIKPGRYKQPASPADVAPTFAHLLGVPLPTAEGRVLTEALAGAAHKRVKIAAGR